MEPSVQMSSRPYEKFNNEVYEPQQPLQHQHQGHVQPPQYHRDNYSGQTTVTIANLQQDIPVKWSWCHLVLSVISLFCCSIFGIVATVMSLLSYVDHKTKDYARSRSKKRVAIGFGIAAVVIGCLVFITGIIVLVMSIQTVAATEKTLEGMEDDFYQG